MYYYKTNDDQYIKTLRLFGCNKRAINSEDNRI